MTSPRRLWLRWTLYCGAGELLGILAAAGIAVGSNLLVGDDISPPGYLRLFGGAALSGLIAEEKPSERG